MENGKIAAGLVVEFHYELREKGKLLDDSRKRGTPMIYLHGSKNIVPGLEQALEGREVGSTFRVEVPPKLGYGVRRGGPQPVPRHIFPEDADLTPGDSFTTKTPEGRPMMLWITRVDGDQVWVDPHHPLAGKKLRYDVEVISLRPATPEELEKGHPSQQMDIEA